MKPLYTLFTVPVFVSLTWALACEPTDDFGEPELDAPQVEHPDATKAPAHVVERDGKRRFERAHGDGAERVVVENARESFEHMVALIDEHYVDGPLTQDELWTGAMEGVLARLIQTEGHEINALLSPAALQELMIGTKGQLVGVGVVIERVANVLVIRDLIPDAPAQAAGLAPGDRILAIDDVRVTDLSLAEIVDRIRGPEGSSVTLFVQRDTEEWSVDIERGVVTMSSVEATMLGEGEEDQIAYLRINSFAETTAADLDALLAELDQRGMKGLVIDLRGCPGGLLDSAIEVADRFLPAGARVMTMRGRDGEEHRDASETDPYEALPLAVLVGPHSASSAEILAAALAEHERAVLVGEPTMGKGTVEAIHDLPHGWALKLSTKRFFSPSGEARQGQGLVPDFVVTGSADHKPVPLRELDVAADPVLRAGLELLTR